MNIQSLRRFAIFESEDGIYENPHGSYVLFRDVEKMQQRIAELEKELQPPPPTPAQLRLLANVEKFERKIGRSPERIPHENYTLGWRYASPEIQGEFSAFSAEQD